MFLNDYKIGADPEFVLLDSRNNPLRLGDHWRSDYGDMASATVGLDHSGRVAELRPTATKGTYTLIKSMKRLLTENAFLKAVPGVSKILAGAIAPGGDSMGGHVHFDYARFGSRFDAPVLEGLNALTDHFVEAGFFPEEDVQKRLDHGYGSPRDAVRFQEGRSIEYRCAPSWLYSPQLAMMYLTAAKLIPLNPVEATKLLRRRAFYRLKEFYELFAKDSNAKRVLEKIIEPAFSPEDIPQDPSVDIRDVWARPLDF